MWSDLKRYRQAAPAERRLLCEALAALALARIAMACIPFRRIAAWLGTPGLAGPDAVSPQQDRVAALVGWAVSVLGPRVPWDGRCLAQALAATAMLRRRGIEGTVSFGVSAAHAPGFTAHAWLRVGSRIVTGAPGHEIYSAFTTFARSRS